MISWILRQPISLWCVDAYMNHKILVHISVQVSCIVTPGFFCAQDFDTSASYAMVKTIKFYPRRYAGNIYILTYKFIGSYVAKLDPWHFPLTCPYEGNNLIPNIISQQSDETNRIGPFPYTQFAAVRVWCPDTRAYCLLCLTVILTCQHFHPIGCLERSIISGVPDLSYEMCLWTV